MDWFLLSMVGPLLYAMTNHIDKILLQNYFQEEGVGTLILFSALLSAAALPILYAVDTNVFSVPTDSIIQLFVVGALNIVVLWAYLVALRDDEATIVIVFYQLVPVIAGVMGYFFLGEVLNGAQMGAMAVIMIATTLVSFDFSRKGAVSFRRHTVFYMLIATTAWATEATLFKAVALDENVWRSVFWEHVALVVFGALLALLAPSLRRKFIAVWTANSKKVLALNGANEALFMVGNVTVSYAMLLAPIAIILLAESFQPVFVFLIGAFFTIFFPHFYRETLTRTAIIQKLVAVALSCAGAYWLVSATP